MMVRAAGLLTEGRRVPGRAGTAIVEPSWAPVARRIRQATDDWDDQAAADRFVDKGGTLVRGVGRIVSNDTVEADGHRYRAARGIVLSTGSAPSIPPIDGLDGTPYWTNRAAIETEHVPASLVVLGGGPIGAELAQVFARFGATVTVVETAERLVPNEEPEAGERLAGVFHSEGIDVVLGTTVTRVEHDRGFHLHLDEGNELMADQLLVATGRHVDLAAIAVDAAGLDPSAESLDVDEHLRVAEGLWAVGDITGEGAFTHVATYQSSIAAADILDEPHPPADYRAVPRVTFTDPEIGAVGLTVERATAAGIEVAVGRTETASTARGWIHGAGNDGFVERDAGHRA
jgi:pyruvate/2-oxoglutarate dehydrogenase complex dihydrolipoamide dehydrogenase (E3) component